MEDNLFKVPKLYFEKDSDMFKNILGRDHEVEKFSDEKPICLYSIQKIDFERFLAATHPM